MAENIAYFKKNPRALKEKRDKIKKDKKRKLDGESSAVSEQNSGSRPRPTEGRSESTMVAYEVVMEPEEFQPIDLDASTVETVECSYLVSRSRRQGVNLNQIDFILDTATESSTIRPSDSSLASNLRADPISLVGVGDLTVVSDSCGDSIFGQTRVLEMKNNLVSQYQVRQYYKLI